MKFCYVGSGVAGGEAEGAAPSPEYARGDIAVGFNLVADEGGSVEALEACARSLSAVAVYGATSASSCHSSSVRRVRKRAVSASCSRTASPPSRRWSSGATGHSQPRTRAPKAIERRSTRFGPASIRQWSCPGVGHDRPALPGAHAGGAQCAPNSSAGHERQCSNLQAATRPPSFATSKTRRTSSPR